MTIRLVDSNNYFRRMIETDSSGIVMRNLIAEVERNPGVEIWVWDGMHGNRRRRNIYPKYKSKRVSPGEDFFKTQALFQAALLHTKAIQVRVPEYEGDDVVATLALRYDTPIRIVSTDKDLLQLCVNSNVTQDRPPISGVSNSDVRLYKTLVGDQSDTISGIPGFGEKAWANCHKLAFREFFEDPRVAPTDVDKVMDEFVVSKKAASFIVNNTAELRAMWEIIGFFPVPADLIAANTVVGKSNPAGVDQTLGAFFQ